MLEYADWGNPSSILLSPGEDEEEPTHHQNPHTIFNHYTTQNNLAAAGNLFISTSTTTPTATYNSSSTNVDHDNPFQGQNHQIIYDPPTYNNNHNNLPYPSTAFSPESMAGTGGGAASSSTHFMIPHKNQNFCADQQRQLSSGFDFSASPTTRIGLNLGGRTYFSSEDDFVNRLYRRSRHFEPGPINVPRCQAEGCNADLTHSKHYHRRHKVCEFHSKASTVQTAGLTQRFCQQCSRFHLLCEFDQGKRSCRKRLADHNRRRRKSNPPTPLVQQQPKLEHMTSTYGNPARSSPDSGGGKCSSSPSASSSVTMAISHLDQCRLVMRT